MRAHLTEENELSVEISDTGVGIADVAQAMQPLYTSAAEMNGLAWDFPSWSFYGPSGGREQYRRGNCCTYVESFGAEEELVPICRQRCGTAAAAGYELWRRGNFLSGHREEKRMR